MVIKTLDLELAPDPDPHWNLYLDPQLASMLDPYPDPHEINADPKPCLLAQTRLPGASRQSK
jgi:hypothetical protein